VRHAEGKSNKQGRSALKGLVGKVAVVTGGGQGIGRGLTLRLAEEGCRIAIFDINPKAGEETAKLAPQSVIKTYAVDVGEAASVNARLPRSKPSSARSGFWSTMPAGIPRCRS
jgi:NADP-dependent 3-hydroxy acid dehydrogenase YdfG